MTTIRMGQLLVFVETTTFYLVNAEILKGEALIHHKQIPAV
jgi:hypothetical protein